MEELASTNKTHTGSSRSRPTRKPDSIHVNVLMVLQYQNPFNSFRKRPMTEKSLSYGLQLEGNTQLSACPHQAYPTKRTLSMCWFLSISPGIFLVYSSASWMFIVFGSKYNNSCIACGGLLGTLVGCRFRQINLRWTVVCFQIFTAVSWLIVTLATQISSWQLMYGSFFFEGVALGLVSMILSSHAMKLPRPHCDELSGFVLIGMMMGVFLLCTILNSQRFTDICFILGLISTAVATVCIPFSTDAPRNVPKLCGSKVGESTGTKLVEVCLNSLMGIFLFQFTAVICMSYSSAIVEAFFVFCLSALLFTIIFATLRTTRQGTSRTIPGLVFTGALSLLLIRIKLAPGAFIQPYLFSPIMALLGLSGAMSWSRMCQLCTAAKQSQDHCKTLVVWWLFGLICSYFTDSSIPVINPAVYVFVILSMGLLLTLLLFIIPHVTSPDQKTTQEQALLLFL
ncbi:hypothetical protein T265_01278 [Opisthorchis viverrini]|uniref:Uncharacterized protein n=1 Tax=Opisthorchis viverrini TaxID=6198 RepID=A0A075AAJ8_OPIVI|nr:hypothetical protein T265_01278 [Opisthorchis viverrini]KER32805.1 hypothetical protein T265_01278 [Opisthorchis viverrini]